MFQGAWFEGGALWDTASGMPSDFLWWCLSSLAQPRTSVLASATRRNEVPPGPPPCILATLMSGWPGPPAPPGPSPAPGPLEQRLPPELAVRTTGNSAGWPWCHKAGGTHSLAPGSSTGRGAHPVGRLEKTHKMLTRISRGAGVGRGQGWGLAGVDPLAATAYSSVHKEDPCACVARPPWPKGSESPSHVAPPPPSLQAGVNLPAPRDWGAVPPLSSLGTRAQPLPPILRHLRDAEAPGAALCRGRGGCATPLSLPSREETPEHPCRCRGQPSARPGEALPGELAWADTQSTAASIRPAEAVTGSAVSPPKYVHVLAPVPLENVPLSRKRVLADAAMVKALRWDHSD